MAPNIKRRSFTIVAGVEITEHSRGRRTVQSRDWCRRASLLIKNHQLHYVNNWLGEVQQNGLVREAGGDRQTRPHG